MLLNPLLDQFISETRDFLQGIASGLIALERQPGSAEAMSELFRLVHTLKGNSGLFELPEMSRVLHAAEDLMDAVRDGRLAYSQGLGDELLDAMDFVAGLVDELEHEGATHATRHVDTARKRVGALRARLPDAVPAAVAAPEASGQAAPRAGDALPAAFAPLSEAVRMAAYRDAFEGAALSAVRYTPEAECFFKGEDPFFLMRQVPGQLAFHVSQAAPWPAPEALDPYRCNLVLEALTVATPQALDEHFRYVPEQVAVTPLLPRCLVRVQGTAAGAVEACTAGEFTALFAAGDPVAA